VILSVCGFPEMANFSPMRDMFRHTFRNPATAIVGELFRPNAESLTRGELIGPVYAQVKEAFVRAGQELVEQGFVSSAVEEAVQAPLMKDQETFRVLANAWWRIAIDYHQAKAQGQDLPDLQEYAWSQPGLILTGMAAFMDPAAAGDLEAVIQFELEEPKASFHLVIKDGKATCLQGRADDPTLTLTTPWPVWLSVSRGELNGQEAFTSGRVKAQGDLGLLMRFDSLFKG
jgi:putative sterol carrier protein